jgi:uncharacterized protein YbaP (TraB family)
VPPILSAALAVLLLAAAPAFAQCQGQNLIDDLPPDIRAEVETRAAAAPFPQGNLWRATRDGQEVTLVGTYHLADPRHDALMTTLGPLVDSAATLLVEAGPEEEKALLDLMGRDPSILVAPEGPTLAESLPQDEWQRLAQAMRDRGMPPFMASRFRPWYVTMLLSIPPCAMSTAMDRSGLDRRLIERAAAAGKPVAALEPFDTALKLFDQMGPEAQLSMIRATLALEDRAEDQMATLTATYFAERSRLLWEYTRHIALTLPGTPPEQAEAEFAAMEEALVNARNRAWIPVIEAAAAKGPLFVGFGALHLSGEEGVLNLLAQNGWTVTRLPLE